MKLSLRREGSGRPVLTNGKRPRSYKGLETDEKRK